MAAKLLPSELVTLATVHYLMGDFCTNQSHWSEKEIDAYSSVMQEMFLASKSAEIRSIAKFLPEAISELVGEQSVYENMQITMAACKKILEGKSKSFAIRYLFWLLQAGRAVSSAERKGWFTGGTSAEKIMSARSNLLGTVAPVAIMGAFIENGEFNLPLSLDNWVAENGA
jgi:hypothetical protein